MREAFVVTGHSLVDLEKVARHLERQGITRDDGTGDENLPDAHNSVVIVRHIPSSSTWPDLAKIWLTLQRVGYERVTGLLILRPRSIAQIEDDDGAYAKAVHLFCACLPATDATWFRWRLMTP